MKKIITISIISIFTLSISAQSLLPKKYGVKFGINSSSLNSTSNDGVENLNISSSIGLTGGFYMQIPLNDIWYINTELLYTERGGSFNFNYVHDYAPLNSRDEYSTENTLKLSYVDFNPTLSFKTSEKLALNIGPSLSFLISEEYTFSEEKINGDSSIVNTLDPAIYESESLNVGLNFGLSFYVNESFLLDANINAGLMSIGTITKETQLPSFGNIEKSNIYELSNYNFAIAFAYLF